MLDDFLVLTIHFHFPFYLSSKLLTSFLDSLSKI